MPVIKPMLAESIDINNLNDYINDDNYWIEQKLDGERIVFHIQDGRPIPINRNGNQYTRPIPNSVLRSFSEPVWVGQWAIDGELLNGRFYVFDIPHLAKNGAILVGPETRLEERRQLLEKLFSLWSADTVELVQTAKTTEDKQALVDTVRRANGEGVMIKKKDAFYQRGRRSRQMLKAKFTSTLEAFIIEIGRDGKRSVAVGLYNDDGDVVDIGTVAMSDRNLPRMNIGDVIEVRYLYCGNGYRLYQPAFLRKRDDKQPEECTVHQLKMVNKDVQYLGRR